MNKLTHQINCLLALMIFANTTNCISTRNISEEIKFKLSQETFRLMDSTGYQLTGFGLVDYDYLMEKPEIKTLMPEFERLYDTLKTDLKVFIKENEYLFPEDISLKACLKDYNNMNDDHELVFYYFGLGFDRFAAYLDDGFLLKEKINAYKVTEIEKINRHGPKLHFALMKYIEPGYIDDIADNTVYWHRFSILKDGKRINKIAILYYSTKYTTANLIFKSDDI